jgi:adenosylcobinamide-phosphate synthase
LIYVRIGYPVTWIGALIDALENRWNDRNLMRRRMMGAFCVGLVMGAVILPAVRVKCCCRQACAA